MKKFLDLSDISWTLTGFVPYEWQLGRSMELGVRPKVDTGPVKAALPGSVQKALLDAKIIPDWNIGFNSVLCEWVENRHWLYEAKLPDEWFQTRRHYRLNCLGLDSRGSIYLNGKLVYEFMNSFIPHRIDLTSHLKSSDNVLQFIFECPPRWQGQFGHTSAFRDFKPRFNYTWDWVSRLVQIGFWDNVFIETYDESEISDIMVQTDYDCQKNTGTMNLKGSITNPADNQIQIQLFHHNQLICEYLCPAARFTEDGFTAHNLKISPWFPNGIGEQICYDLIIRLLDCSDQLVDQKSYNIGFKNIKWQSCSGAHPKADPWICAVNEKPVFLQGFNWTPIRPNFADVTEADYRKRLELYHQMGCNILRVWGGGFLEKDCFYRLCDQFGIFVWQEFPLSSSGIENYPPEDEVFIEHFLETACSYITRRSHHVSLLLWSGGNELTTRDKNPKPLGESHPLIEKLAALVRRIDPAHRFVASSPSGPEFFAHPENYGKGQHWDVHGPWKVDGLLDARWEHYWQQDDSLFRSEVGAPGPSDVQIIQKYKGDCDELPADLDNPLWRRTGWWAEGETFELQLGRKPKTLDEYVQWGQQRQAEILTRTVKSCKDRFPKCGGIIIWMGHDCFPCTANTSVIDFEGNPKPAAEQIKNIFRVDLQ